MPLVRSKSAKATFDFSGFALAFSLEALFVSARRCQEALLFGHACVPKEATLYDLLPHLSPEVKPFCKITRPDISRPGVFVGIPPLKIGPKTGLGSLFSRKPEVYGGKVVILVNGRTMSHGEFVTMAFQTCPDVTVIGSQTAGADGNVSQLVLPGGIQTAFSGLGVYYPDGKETQRTGIVRDISVLPTVEGLRRGEDEVLNRAVRFLTDGE